MLGIALMVAAMLVIPLVDGAAKFLSQSSSPLFISWARYAVAAVFLVPIAMLRFGRHIMPSSDLGAHLLRTLFLLAAMTMYFVAISFTDLAIAASAYFCAPGVATLIAVFVYGERLNSTKAFALLLGFGGVLLVVRPGLQWETGSLLGLGAGIFFAFYLVATRVASRTSDPLKTLVFQTLVGMLVLLPQAVWTWALPARETWLFFAALGGLSLVSHFLAIQAFRFAQTSTLAPLVYVELLGVIAVGIVFFDEMPPPIVWIGASIIILAGLLMVRADR
jgi:drug/metabolite transporter (DMT)-like permease